MRHSLVGPQVASLEIGSKGPRRPTYRGWGPLPEVILEKVPDIAHGSVAIANVQCFLGVTDPFGAGGAGGNDEVIGGKVETAHQLPKEGEIVLVAGFSERKALKKRSGHPALLEYRIHLVGSVNQREKISLGEKFEEGEKHFFPAPHSSHPIVNDGDFQVWVSSAGKIQGFGGLRIKRCSKG